MEQKAEPKRLDACVLSTIIILDMRSSIGQGQQRLTMTSMWTWAQESFFCSVGASGVLDACTASRESAWLSISYDDVDVKNRPGLEESAE